LSYGGAKGWVFLFLSI